MNKPKCKVSEDGTKSWSLQGSLHREDGPAIEWSDGTKSWYLNGKLHREDGPAVEWANGDKWWCLHNKEAHPEQIVDLWLEREVFCWYDEANETLNFAEDNGKRKREQ